MSEDKDSEYRQGLIDLLRFQGCEDSEAVADAMIVASSTASQIGPPEINTNPPFECNE